MSTYAFSFPVIRGVQAGRAYYVTMCPLRLIPRIFLYDEEELDPELRAQRTLNKARVPGIASYILENPNDYVFSSLTASIDTDIEFVPAGEANRDLGTLRVPLNARFLINDGQHRRAAIEVALREAPHLGDETISVVFFVDPGTRRAQQMFTDLNRYAVRPSRSLSLLYDHRDSSATVAREVARQAECFRGVVEFDRTNLAPRSAKLFTLSAIETATDVLLAEQRELSLEDQVACAVAFWEGVAVYMVDWTRVRKRQVAAGEVRRDSIAAHGIALSALAIVGRSLLAMGERDWVSRLAALGGVDWSRTNTALWEGRAMTGGRISKAHSHVRRTAAALKELLAIPLSPEDFEILRQEAHYE